MNYHVFVLRRAQKALAKVPVPDRQRLQESICNLADDPRPTGCRKLRGRDGWRIRKGEYRVIYEIDDAEREVTVLDVGHRRDAYR